MYIIMTRCKTGNDWYGPFPNRERAEKYAQEFHEDVFSYEVHPLIIPFVTVVKEIIWH